MLLVTPSKELNINLVNINVESENISYESQIFKAYKINNRKRRFVNQFFSLDIYAFNSADDDLYDILSIMIL